MRVIGYVRVSTVEQADSGLGLEAQRSAIEAEVARRGWHISRIYEDAGRSGSSMRGRVGLANGLAEVEGGTASALVVAKLDRLSRSMIDFAGLMERSRKKGWSLVALDLGVDTTTPAGEVMATVMAAFAQYERRLIGQRTRDALAVKRAEGATLGRPRVMPDEIRQKICELYASGLSLTTIAALLNEEGVNTARGGQAWYPSTVRRVVAGGASRPRTNLRSGSTPWNTSVMRSGA